MRSSATLLILLLCTVFRASYALPAATNTTSQAPQPTSTQGLTCPVSSNTVATANTRTITPRGLSLFDTFTSLFRRQGGSEFVGWHGTTGVNACKYTNAGRMGGSIPVLDQFNGADAELGPGLYVTDDITTARVFAVTTANARRNAGVTDPLALLPAVCKVEAISQMNWRNNVPKYWIPFANLARLIPGVGNNPTMLDQQAQLITNGGLNPANTIRFSALVSPPNSAGGTNQMSIPRTQFPNLRITECLPTSNNDPDLILGFTGVTAANRNTFTHPGFIYQAFRQVVQGGVWGILGNNL